jgi:hypothetical protein
MFAEADEPDLFDYFDPLLSPHVYRDGISPDTKPDEMQSGMGSQEPGLGQLNDVADPMLTSEAGLFRLIQASGITAHSTVEATDSSPDIFDPLLSPHRYPNGTPDRVVGDEQVSDVASLDSGSIVQDGPSDLSLMFSLMSSGSVSAVPENRFPTADSDFFDPTLSPHAYPNGTPELVVGDKGSAPKRKRLGILLMDHGSRNAASNEQLHKLARIYQETVDERHVVVLAAHMELATPTIPEGIEALWKDHDVDEIVCHPFFLSAQGRHVSEDIPSIVEGAVESLGIDIPVVTTEPVGSQTDMMIVAIQSLVKQSSTILRD